MQAKYTFFEAAAQHGQIVALMAPRMQKSKDFYNIIIDQNRGRVFRMFKTARPDEPYFEFVIPERDTTESQFMWREKARKALDKAWIKNEALKAQERELRRSGAGSSEPSSSPASNPPSSSTEPVTRPESSVSQSAEEVPVATVSGPDRSTQASSQIEPPSSKGSGRPSRKSGSKPRSSSTA